MEVFRCKKISSWKEIKMFSFTYAWVAINNTESKWIKDWETIEWLTYMDEFPVNEK
jgi:hypothetical protein